MGADRGFAELAVDGQRLAEDKDFRAERLLAAAADDDVAGAERPVEAGVEPGLHREVARGIEGDDVHRLVEPGHNPKLPCGTRAAGRCAARRSVR